MGLNTKIVESACKVVYVIKEIDGDIKWVIIFQYS